jgi:hypothetical protein
MADLSDIVQVEQTESNTAVFKKRRVFGIDRYYPKNELATNLVNFKQVTTQQNKKAIIKCLTLSEIKVAITLGIFMILE